MHWMKLIDADPDLAGRRGAPLRCITREELARHASAADGWLAVNGRVYNIVPYIEFHPGGAQYIRKLLGTDATEAVARHHAWVNIDGLVGTLELGWLAADEDREDEGESDSRQAATKSVAAADAPAALAVVTSVNMASVVSTER